VKYTSFNLIVTCEIFIIKVFQGGTEMKKVLVSLLTLVMLTVALTGCTPAAVYKYGVGSVIAVSGSAAVPAAGEVAAKDGKYGVNVDIVSVVLNSKGEVVSATWDIAQTSNLKFTVEGALNADPASYTRTKLELGTDYGMKEKCDAATQICKEWNEQSKFLTDYVVGMTAEEVASIALNETGEATSTDILAGTTIGIDSFKEAFAKAVANAVETKKVAKYGVATMIAVTGSAAVPAAGEVAAKDGKYGVNVDIVKVALDKDGKILSATWDIAQTSNLKFTVEGALNADPASYTRTKLELGTDYGMKEKCDAATQICKEWNEQSKFLTDFVVGMKLADVQAIALNEDGEATSTDILAGTTIGVDTFIATLEKAITNAVEVE